jgi:hypothetical protein
MLAPNEVPVLDPHVTIPPMSIVVDCAAEVVCDIDLGRAERLVTKRG